MTLSRNLYQRWTPGALRRLHRYLTCGLTWEECAKLMDLTVNTTRMAAIRYSLIDPHISADRKARAPYEREVGGRSPQRAGRSLHDERDFIEPWSVYSARKKREREAAKLTSPQVTSAGQDSD